MRTRTILCVLVFLTVGTCAVLKEENDDVDDQPFNGDKVIRVVPNNEQQLEVLRNIENNPDVEVDFWSRPERIGLAVDMHISRNTYRKLTVLLHQEGIQFTILIADVQKVVNLEEKNLGRMSGSFFSKYQTLETIVEELKNIANRYSMVSMFSVGRSYEGRSQDAVEIKGKQFPNKPVFFMNCGMHAREWITPATCMYIIRQFASKYGKDSEVTAVLDKMDFVIMPVLNADGYVYTWKGKGRKFRFWRKTRKPNSGSRCVGTDPNRNWGYTWGKPGASGNPCSDAYRGTKEFSEVETRNVARYLKRRRSTIKGYMDIHAYSQLWMFPWGYSKSRTNDHNELMRVSLAGTNALRRVYGTYFKSGSIAQVIYQASGSSVDYAYGALGIKYSFALELRDKGRYGFLLPPNQIVPTGRETFKGILALAKAMRV